MNYLVALVSAAGEKYQTAAKWDGLGTVVGGRLQMDADRDATTRSISYTTTLTLNKMEEDEGDAECP